jgi:hypothetical protein
MAVNRAIATRAASSRGARRGVEGAVPKASQAAAVEPQALAGLAEQVSAIALLSTGRLAIAADRSLGLGIYRPEPTGHEYEHMHVRMNLHVTSPLPMPSGTAVLLVLVEFKTNGGCNGA